MTLGEYLIAFFVFAVFSIGIYFGIRLLKWNLKDMKAKEERNRSKRNNQIKK
tara:strand:+ start:781 stop:936 length:156 start_codon:yes stop_codon:yes gene_type:complete